MLCIRFIVLPAPIRIFLPPSGLTRFFQASKLRSVKPSFTKLSLKNFFASTATIRACSLVIFSAAREKFGILFGFRTISHYICIKRCNACKG